MLDGEVAVFDERLVSRFDLLAEPDPDTPTTPPVYIAFDVLYAGGRDLRARPLAARRESSSASSQMSARCSLSGGWRSNGRKAWDEVLARGIEGYVGKDPASTYLTGGPTRSWLKAKVRQEGRFSWAVSWSAPKGGACFWEAFEDGRLIYRGLVHFGVGRRLADALITNGLVRATSPFSERISERKVTWLDPRLEVEVTYAQALPGGALRAPVFRGFVAA